MESEQPTLQTAPPSGNRLKTVLWIIAIFLWFVFALDLMVSSLKALGEPAAEFILQATSNPFTALFIGLLATAMIQSSSTTTSLVVALVVSGSLTLENAVPVIMGANIGTTITSTLVSLGFIRKKKEFRRAVAAGTYHDFFNILTVLVLFPLEYYYNLLSQTTRYITAYLLKFIPVSAEKISAGSPLSPLTDWLVTVIPGLITPAIIAFILLFTSILVFRRYISGLLLTQSPQRFRRFFFQNTGKAFLWGLITTAAIRSSTITTSVAVPLVAQKITSLRKAAPFILGANLGTTITAIIAALLNFGSSSAISIALAHFLFNCIGIVLFYLIPPLKEIPFYLANRLGRLTLRYRLVGFVYLLTTFFFLPFSLIYMNQNPARTSEAAYESVDMRTGKTTTKKIVVRQHRSNLAGEWMIYDTENNFRLVPVFRRANTLLIGDDLWILGPVGTCWTGTDSLGKYNRCVENFYSSWQLPSGVVFDSVYIIRQEQLAGYDSLTMRFYISAIYPLVIQQERERNDELEYKEQVTGFRTK